MTRFNTLLAGIAIAGSALMAQHVVAQSHATSRTYNVGTFGSIAAAGPNLVIVHVGGAPSVRAEGPSETLDKMEVIVEHGDLQIRPRAEFRNHFDWSDMKKATFTVTAPQLTAASIAGSGDMRVDRAEGTKFAASVAGSGSMEIATMRVDRANLSMAGSGDLTVHGSAGRAEVSIAGSGAVHAHGVNTRTASVSIAGSGDAELTAQDLVNVSIVGSGNAEIAGGAHCTVSRIGSGEAHCAA